MVRISEREINTISNVKRYNFTNYFTSDEKIMGKEQAVDGLNGTHMQMHSTWL